jgi:hypothetical protein
VNEADQRRYDFGDCWTGAFGPRLAHVARMFRSLPGYVPTLRTMKAIARRMTVHGSPVGGTRKQRRARQRRAIQHGRAWAKYAKETGNVF